jgi:hypothetical protein
MIAALLATNLDTSKYQVRLSDMPDDELGKDRIHINSISAIVRGGGRRGMKLICQNADDLKITLSLNACPYYTSLYQELLPLKNLIQWYEKFGFKRVDLQTGIFVHMSALMVRYPEGSWRF